MSLSSAPPSPPPSPPHTNTLTQEEPCLFDVTPYSSPTLFDDTLSCVNMLDEPCLFDVTPYSSPTMFDDTLSCENMEEEQREEENDCVIEGVDEGEMIMSDSEDVGEGNEMTEHADSDIEGEWEKNRELKDIEGECEKAPPHVVPYFAKFEESLLRKRIRRSGRCVINVFTSIYNSLHSLRLFRRWSKIN